MTEVIHSSRASNVGFFQDSALTLQEAIELVISSILAYALEYRHWAIAFSGGKDSSTVLALILHLIEAGRIPRPDSLTVLYADTRMELPMLHASAQTLLEEARARGCRIITVIPPLEDRFFVRMLGKGYPPPHNGFRWCVGLLKIKPMQAALHAIYELCGKEKFLTLTGMRVGESAVRDRRFLTACSKNDGECSQGWYQKTTPASISDVLAPVLHMRVCHVADILGFEAPEWGFTTLPVLRAYGADAGDSESLAARTGCIRCPVAGHDTTLDRVIKFPEWAYLTPFSDLLRVYTRLSSSHSRLRKTGERKKNGDLSKRPMREGPLTMRSRLWGLAQIKAIQDEVNRVAVATGRPEVWLINQEEEEEIHRLIQANTWPDKWDGTEVEATEMVNITLSEGVVQPILFALERDM
jgi:DNA sulfur modification protein DndC